MASTINFDVDVNAIVFAIFGSIEQRNDLVAIVENGSALTLTADYLVENGNLKGTNGGPVIQGTPPTIPPPTTMTPVTWAIGIDAANAGSNVFVYLRSGEHTWGIIAAAPSNKENYFKYVYYGWGKGKQDTYNACDDTDKLYSEGGYYTFTAATGSTAPGTEVVLQLNNVSPAEAFIRIYPVP